MTSIRRSLDTRTSRGGNTPANDDADLNTFRQALLERDFIVTATPYFSADTDRATIVTAAESLRGHADALVIGIGDPNAPGLDAIAAAAVAVDTGVDPVLHLDCRDRNRPGLAAALKGALALGVSSVVTSRGRKYRDSPDTGTRAPKGVFDTRAEQLLEMAAGIRTVNDEPALVVGAQVTVFPTTADWQAGRLAGKLDAGARFLVTRPVLNAGLVRKYAARLVSLRITRRASLIVSVPLLTSARQAQQLPQLEAGSRVPAAIGKRLAAADDPAAAGTELCREMIDVLRATPGVAGVNVVCFDAPQRAAEILEALADRQS